MPLIDRIKSLFARKGEEEKKIGFLAERRTALSQQRDRAYEEMATLEKQDESLKRNFREATAQVTKKRVTTQLLQLRKNLERRQQLVGVLNQQIDVVSAHLHNLELVKQGTVAALPDTDEITADAVRAEEMLAELEAAGELAGMSAPSGVSGLTAEEKVLFEELEAEMRSSPAAVTKPAAKQGTLSVPVEQNKVETQDARPTGQQAAVRRSEPEAG